MRSKGELVRFGRGRSRRELNRPDAPVYRKELVRNEALMSDLRTNAFIARGMGIVFIAGGFMLGIYGLEFPNTMWLQTALGLLVTGMMAQGYAMYCSIRWVREQRDSER